MRLRHDLGNYASTSQTFQMEMRAVSGSSNGFWLPNLEDGASAHDYPKGVDDGKVSKHVGYLGLPAVRGGLCGRRARRTGDSR
jgi:hypothetical protein